MHRLAAGAAVAVAAVALGVVLLGVPTLVLQLPAVTSTLVARYYDPAEGRLPLPLALESAEHVRAYTTSDDAAPLPERVGGRDGFDASAASHLRDVRGVLVGARRATLAAAAALAALLAWLFASGRRREAALALRAGSLGMLAFAVLVAAWAIADFDAFFTAFHGVFFSAGTWTFPYGTLLIQLFPEPFWAALGGLWVLGVLGGAAVALLAARRLTRSNRGLVGQEV